MKNWNEIKFTVECMPGDIPIAEIVAVSPDVYQIVLRPASRENAERRSYRYCKTCRVTHQSGETCPREDDWRKVQIDAGFLHDMEIESRRIPVTMREIIETLARARIPK